VNALPHHDVVISKDVNDKFMVSYAHADISDPPMRVGSVGRGDTVRKAALDYIHQISGKKLIFGEGPKREEVTVAILQTERFVGY